MPTAEPEPAAIARRYQAAFNAGDLDACMALLDEDIEIQLDGMITRGRSAVHAYQASVLRAFPGVTMVDERVVAQSGDTAVIEFKLVNRSASPSAVQAPAEPWRLDGLTCRIVRVAGGRIVELRNYYQPSPADRTGLAEIPSRSEAARIADERAALGRVASLVARGVPHQELFAAVNEEVARIVNAETAALFRLDPDDTMTLLAAWSTTDADHPLGERQPLNDRIRAIRDSARPSRYGPAELPASGPFVEEARRLGIVSSVGVPIVVDGVVWGINFVARRHREPFPGDAEARMTGFTELVAAALAGAHRQAALQDMADRDAALRRVAELVARGAAPGAVFDAVAVEASRLLDGVPTILLRFEDDDTYTPVATCRHPLPIGERYPVETGGTAERIRRTGGTARMDTYADRPDLRVSYAIGLRSSAAAPIVVDGRVWGMLSAVSFDGPLPPSSEPDLARFTELVALAIANAESRTALVASRARVVATGDEARRRLQRDVHDGAQQRLVQAVITLKLARAAAGGDGRVAPLIDEALRHAEQATAELRDLVRGILPASLSRGGLRAGVGTLVSGLPLPVDVDVDPVRLAPELETTAYFVIAEALTNVVKHARAGSARVGVHVRDGAVQIEVRDDGIGGAVAGRGTGLTGLSDRVAAAEGEVEISSPAGEGTRVSASLPVRP